MRKGKFSKVLEVLLLDDILVTLRRRVPEGKIHPIKVEVGDKLVPVSTVKPWISADIRNDGPDPVYVMVNEVIPPHMFPPRPPVRIPALESAEMLSVDMKEPLIEVIYLICEKGKKATVRIFAKR